MTAAAFTEWAGTRGMRGHPLASCSGCPTPTGCSDLIMRETGEWEHAWSGPDWGSPWPDHDPTVVEQ